MVTGELTGTGVDLGVDLGVPPPPPPGTVLPPPGSVLPPPPLGVTGVLPVVGGQYMHLSSGTLKQAVKSYCCQTKRRLGWHQHSHKIPIIQQGTEPSYLGILCNPCSDQERYQAVKPC